MNAIDILKYGHLTVLGTLDGFPKDRWEIAGACGAWSVKNLVAHLASFERVLADLLPLFVTGDPATFQNPIHDEFNNREVAQRAHLSPAQTLEEYTTLYARVAELIEQVPPDVARQPGTMPWYGADYSLDDYLVYTFYGHKREHCGQIAIFRDRVAQTSPAENGQVA
jgi:hypothetical protein